jgi:hypothetical protein
MKKVVFIASAIVTCFLLSCSNSGGGMSDKAKKNLEASQAIGKMFEAADFSKLGDYVAADGIDHSGMEGEITGVDNMKAAYTKVCSAMSEMKNETVKEWADDDYTVQWMKESSTMKTDMMGMKAGSHNTMNAIEVSKYNSEGKATDHWTFISWGDMMKMMPQPGAMDKMSDNKMEPKKDSTDSKMQKK